MGRVSISVGKGDNESTANGHRIPDTSGKGTEAQGHRSRGKGIEKHRKRHRGTGARTPN